MALVSATLLLLAISTDLKPFSHSFTFLCLESVSFVKPLLVPCRQGQLLPRCCFHSWNTPLDTLIRLLLTHRRLCANQKRCLPLLQDTSNCWKTILMSRLFVYPVNGALLGLCFAQLHSGTWWPYLCRNYCELRGFPSARFVWPEQALSSHLLRKRKNRVQIYATFLSGKIAGKAYLTRPFALNIMNIL